MQTYTFDALIAHQGVKGVKIGKRDVKTVKAKECNRE